MIFGYRYAGKRRRLVGVATGSVAGAITGSFGVPAFPLSAIYFHNSASEPGVIRSNVLTAICFTLIFSIVGLAAHGVYSEASLLRASLVFPIFTLGIYLGHFLFRIAPADWFAKVTYGVLICSGLVLMTT